MPDVHAKIACKEKMHFFREIETEGLTDKTTKQNKQAKANTQPHQTPKTQQLQQSSHIDLYKGVLTLSHSEMLNNIQE